MAQLDARPARLDINAAAGDDVAITLTTTTTTWLDGETMSAPVTTLAGASTGVSFTASWNAGTLSLSLTDTDTGTTLGQGRYKWRLTGTEGGVTTTHLAGNLILAAQSDGSGSTSVNGSVTVTSNSVSLTTTQLVAPAAVNISVSDSDAFYVGTNAEAVFAELPAAFAPRNDSPGAIVPPITSSMAGSAVSAWFGANFSTGSRFSIDRDHYVIGATLPCGTASGNIEVSIHQLFWTNASTKNEFVSVKVATSGIIACPTPTSGKIFVAFTATTKLVPGTYTVQLWCDNTTATFVHNLSNTMTQAGMCVAPSGTSVTATAESGLMYYGGRGVVIVIEEAGIALGTARLLGDSITQNYKWWEVAEMLSGSVFTTTNKGVAGEGSSAIAARVATDVVAFAPTCCTVLAGTNDILTETAATIQANLLTIYNALNTAGIDIIACTIPPRDAASLGSHLSAGQAAVLSAVNTWIRARTDVAVICDWTDELSTGDGTTPSSTYFTDQVHPNAAGVKLMGQIMASTLSIYRRTL